MLVLHIADCILGEQVQIAKKTSASTTTPQCVASLENLQFYAASACCENVFEIGEISRARLLVSWMACPSILFRFVWVKVSLRVVEVIHARAIFFVNTHVLHQ